MKSNEGRIVLASASPRRRELLRLMLTDFDVASADVDETLTAALPPDEQVTELARLKGRAVAAERPRDTVIAADTMVFLDGELLGKPRDAADAARMLRKLSGRTHIVYTGVCVVKDGAEHTFCETTAVAFMELTDAELAAYVATGEPLDKAGAYGIQGPAAKFVTGVNGCYFNVMGMPLNRLYRLLRTLAE